MQVGLLVLRFAIGGALLAQGWAKVRPRDRAATTEYFRREGFEPAAALSLFAGVVEVASGLLLVVGLATPLAAAGALGVLFNAVAVNKANGWWAASGGAEYPVALAAVSAALAFTGSGALGVDAVLGIADPGALASVAFVAVGAGSAAPLLVRRRLRLRGGSVAARRQVGVAA